MVTCRCTNLKHPEHLGRMCENLATEPDRHCEACHAHIARERESTKPELPSTGPALAPPRKASR